MKAGKVRAVVPPADRSKRVVSIADLVVWAYRDQMVHAARPEGMPVEIARDWSPQIAQSDFGREMVSSSVKMEFTCAADAYRVHAAVMRLPTVERMRTAEEVECLLARKLCMNEIYALDKETGAINASSLFLTRGDGTREARSELISLPSLVFEYGLKCRAPDWIASPVYAFERGKAIARGRRAERICHLVKSVGDDPLEVEHARSIYTLWARALRLLRADIVARYRLTTYTLNVEIPDEAPWESQATLDMEQKLA